ncbi:hypothetical protein B0T25DRAFT_443757 [Lasiosphaeria hispida]|uniref:Uncharacterized protein n=1 Tax=Lasiosphaeria hispida TaxID=260671 RepID=A0AAJ0HWK1_9PEZI|nr:hypothetical protein B0T25DRAFT_443757 [Lasiosphaeria hispida]
MSRQPSFSNIIHLHDFIDTITDDPSHDVPNFVEIQTDINIFEEDGFYSPNIIVKPVHACIHMYMTREQRDAYVPNAFFYADGRFSAAPSENGTPEINIQALSLMRCHLPEQWCPMVSIIGSVPCSESNSVDPSEPCHFIVETSIYEASKAAPVQFSVACFLENTKRWEKVKTPPAGAFLGVTAKLAGRTVDTNRLALQVLDLTYLPRPNSGTAMPTPTTTPPSKRSRWDGRAPSSTPSKKPRTSKLVDGSTMPSNRNTTPPEATHAGTKLPATGETAGVAIRRLFSIHRCQP